MSKLSQLKWQCRRGVKELELILNYYLEQDYLIASVKEQSAFKQLLALEDPILFDLILGNTLLDNEAQQALIKKLQKHVFSLDNSHYLVNHAVRYKNRFK